MVMMPEPTCQAIRSVKREGTRVVHLSPQGALLNATTCRRLAAYEHLVLLCGHYEGVDQRIIDSEVDEEISIGDYVLSNGCAAAIIVVDAVSRFVPGVVGNEEAVGADSFEQGIFDHPHYTRPEEFENRRVPTVLMSGNHREIDRWRHREAWEKTQKIRPELTKGTVR